MSKTSLLNYEQSQTEYTSFLASLSFPHYVPPCYSFHFILKLYSLLGDPCYFLLLLPLSLSITNLGELTHVALKLTLPFKTAVS